MNLDELTRFLVPRLRYLLNPGESPISPGNQASTNKANKIWQVIGPVLQSQEVGQTASQKLAQDSTAHDWQEVLKFELAKIFEAHPDIATQVKLLWQEDLELHQQQVDPIINMSANGNDNQMIGTVSGQARVFGKVNGSIDESQNKTIADRGGQVSGGNSTRSGSNIFSNNTVMWVLLGVVALGAAAWALGMRVSPDGLEIETQGGEQLEQPQNTAP